MQNGEMYMSAELIGIVIAAVSLLVTMIGGFVGGFGWVIRRMHERFDQVNARIDGVQREMTEVKIAVARLEGPRPRLALPGG